MNTRHRIAFVLFAVAAASLPAPPSRAQTGIRLLDPPIGNGSGNGRAVSADGSVVYGQSNIGFSGSVAFRWTEKDGAVVLPLVEGASETGVFACSPSGAYAAGFTTPHPGSSGEVGWVWSEALGSVAVGPGPGGTGTSRMDAVSDDGVAVGRAAVGFTPTGVSLFRAARWTEAGGLELLPLPAPADETEQSRAIGILPDGRVLGESASGLWLYDKTDGFELLTDEVPFLFSDPDGEVFGGNLRVGTRPDLGADLRASLWTRTGGFEPLATFEPDQFSSLGQMSDDQRVIFGGIEFEGALWFDGEPVGYEAYLTNRGVDLTDLFFTNYGELSGDGRVLVGTARDTSDVDNRPQPFVLTIEPCPADASFDGLLTPEDFVAWVQAYQTGHIRCDQNGDGLCTGADFFAWVVGYAKGCP